MKSRLGNMKPGTQFCVLLPQPAALSKQKHRKPDSSEICTATLYLSLTAYSLTLAFLNFQKSWA